jgi:nickel/cobalt transporter (NicO) family protein
MVIPQPLRILILVLLVWATSSQAAIAQPWLDELESPNLFFSAAELTPGLACMGMGIAFGFGAIHALAPGHGKTMVAAYLVGNRGTARHALLLGLVTTIAHTFSVLCLALVALVAAQYILPEQLYPILSALSGLTVLGVGLWLFRQSLLSNQLNFDWPPSANPGSHDFSHDHHENHDHHEHDALHNHTNCSCGHSHLPETLSLKSLIALGIAGGMVPCPSALVLLLSAIAFHQVPYGIALVSGFSLGMAAVLIALGLVVVYAKRQFEQRPNQITWFRYAPLASASVITLIGIVLTGYAIFPSSLS